jgi:ABC-type lipoprotein release transport system permease subunit
LKAFHLRPEKVSGRFTIFLAWCNLIQARAGTVLSVMAVAIGVSMTIAADIIGGAILNAFTEAGDALKFLHGLLDRFDIGLQMMGMGIAFASGFVVYNAFAIAVTQRRVRIGLMRSIGMSRPQVIKLVLIEAFFVGLFGTVSGLVIGPLLGNGFIVLMKALIGDLFVFASGNASAQSVLVSIVLGIGITLLSTAIPAWRATQVSPLAATFQEVASGVFHTSLAHSIIGGLGVIALGLYLGTSGRMG